MTHGLGADAEDDAACVTVADPSALKVTVKPAGIGGISGAVTPPMLAADWIVEIFNPASLKIDAASVPSAAITCWGVAVRFFQIRLKPWVPQRVS
jgi:hypothetical protein